MRENAIKESISRKIFIVFNTLFLLFIGIICFYPMWYVVCASFSDPMRLMATDGLLWHPLSFTFTAYKTVLKTKLVWSGYLNTFIIIILGVAINMAMTTLAAYFFSRKGLMHSKKLFFIVLFTMFFNGGIVPTYLMIKWMGLLDNLLVLILPAAISTNNMIILRTAFYNVPDSLEEAARIDGASHVVILTKVIMPLILPTMAVIGLYYGVNHWNSWFNASIYITNRRLYPLQLVLRELLISQDSALMSEAMEAEMAKKAMLSETVKYCTITVATIPILCIYPFLQKYFIKGVMVGAVKE